VLSAVDWLTASVGTVVMVDPGEEGLYGEWAEEHL